MSRDGKKPAEPTERCSPTFVPPTSPPAWPDSSTPTSWWRSRPPRSWRATEVIVVDHLDSVELDPTRPVIYDRDIGLRLLHSDPVTGAEHYLGRYPAGLKARQHKHTAAQTIVVLEGR